MLNNYLIKVTMNESLKINVFLGGGGAYCLLESLWDHMRYWESNQVSGVRGKQPMHCTITLDLKVNFCVIFKF